MRSGEGVAGTDLGDQLIVGQVAKAADPRDKPLVRSVGLGCGLLRAGALRVGPPLPDAEHWAIVAYSSAVQVRDLPSAIRSSGAAGWPETARLIALLAVAAAAVALVTVASG